MPMIRSIIRRYRRAVDSWPFMLKSTHRAVQVENFTLKDALGNANAELRKHRVLISELSTQRPETVRAFEKAIGQK